MQSEPYTPQLFPVHTIWIGPNPAPTVWIDTVRDFAKAYGHPFMLWDNRRVAVAQHEWRLQNQAAFDESKAYCGKADVLRYEILHRLGGIYIDADSVVLHPEKLEALVRDFCLSPNHCALGWEKPALLANSVILAKPRSPFLRCVIDEIPGRKKAIRSTEPWKWTGPQLVTEIYARAPAGVHTYATAVFYPRHWVGIRRIDAHKQQPHPPESVLFQFGYTTNNLASQF